MNHVLAARFMGCKRINEAVDALIGRAEDIVLREAHPLHRMVRIPKCRLKLNSRDAEALFAGCDELIAICATLGAAMDRFIRSASVMDISLGLAVNACAAAYLEEYLDALKLPLCEGEYATPRFSPGYGDMPLSNQTALLAVTESRRIGLCETATHMLTPEKSVTAYAGITRVPSRRCDNRCGMCINVNCPYRDESK